MRLILFIVILSCSGCAGQEIESSQERQLQANDYRERFISFRKDCWDRGKRVFVEAKSRPPVAGIPRPGDHYQCF